VSLVLDVYHKGQPARVVAQEVIGLRVLCLVSREHGSELCLFSVGQAVDSTHYWRVWRKLGGGPMVWEDGTPFQPH